jgi:hypothetical protein
MTKFHKLALLPSAGKKALKLVDSLDQAIQSMGTAEPVNLLRCAPDNRCSPMVVAGKMAIEKLKINYKAQK